MGGHEVVATAGYKRSLEALEEWPVAQLVLQAVVAQARVRPRRGKPLKKDWRMLRSLPHRDCPRLLLLFRLSAERVVLGPVVVNGTEHTSSWKGVDERVCEDEFVAWLNAGNGSAGAFVEELLRRSALYWESWIEKARPAFTYHNLEAVADAAYEHLAKDAALATHLADLALAHVKDAAIPDQYGHLLARLTGRLWRERANALRHTAPPRDALAAYQHAAELLKPPVMGEVAACRRGAALVLHDIDHDDAEPLRLIQEGIGVFEQTFEAGELVVSHLHAGLVHFNLRHYEDAWESFEQARSLAESIRDEVMLAHVLLALGNCAQELGKHDDALRHLLTAIPLLDKLGMKGERPHAAWGLAWIYSDKGQIDTALDWFDDAAAAFRRVDKPWHAAEVDLDSAKVMLRAGREEAARKAALELLDTFAAAGMKTKKAEAHELLTMALNEATLTEQEIENVQKALNSGG